MADRKRYEYLEQQIRNIEEEEKTLLADQNELRQQEAHLQVQARLMPLYIKNPELLSTVTEAIKKSEEKICAIKHMKRSLEESLHKLASGPGPSGVIVRGAGEERSVGLGLVSKGAMKEFPSTMIKQETAVPSVPSPLASATLIGINRAQSDSTFVYSKEATLSQQQSQAHHYMAQFAQRVKPPDPSAPSITLGRAAAQFRCEQPFKESAIPPSEPLKLDTCMTAQSRPSHVVEEEHSVDLKRKSGLYNAMLPAKIDAHHSPGIRTAKTIPGRAAASIAPGKAMNEGDGRQSVLSEVQGLPQPLPSCLVSPSSHLSSLTISKPNVSEAPSSSQFVHLSSSVSPTFATQALRQSQSPQVLPTVQSQSPVLKAPSTSINVVFTSPAPVTAVSSIMSPRGSLSVNPNATSHSSAHPSPQSSSAFSASTPGSSPFQMSPSIGGVSPNISASPHSSFGAAFQVPNFVANTNLSMSNVVLSVTESSQPSAVGSSMKAQKVFERAEKSQAIGGALQFPSANHPETVQTVSKVVLGREKTSSESSSGNATTARTEATPSYSNDYEPLSPDAVDSSPQNLTYSSPQAGTPDQNGMRLFSILNLPESGSSSSTSAQQGLLELEESPEEYEEVLTPSALSIQQPLSNAQSTQSGAENYFEPLSDDE